jgi:hypothetical protein
MIPIERRITSKIEVDESCWNWLGFHDRDGYGRFSLDPKTQRGAHRVVYELVRGPIPEGMVIDHLCRNRGCVNPDHMEVVTPVVNSNRQESHNALKTHCPQGHEYSEGNTIKQQGKYGTQRVCRECHNFNRRLQESRC